MENKIKILHTADWHLGKKLSFFNRYNEQVAILNEIKDIANQQKVDLIIIAGDIFDTFNPPVEAIDLLYKTLKQLSNNGTRPVIAIGGNHDSADRIDAPNPLAKECGIIFIGSPFSAIPRFEIPNGFKITQTDEQFLEIELPQIPYPIRVIASAFANEQRLKTYFDPENKLESLTQTLQNTWTNLAHKYCDTKGVNLLTAHLYMNKQGEADLEECESEKSLNIGNADKVYTHAIPPQIQYVALGHLHQMHNVGTKEQPIVYSGSPIAYSFSECNQDKHIVIIEAEPNKVVNYTKIKLNKGRKLFRKTFTSTNDALIWLTKNPETLVELSIE
jgi:exonuclease SbcD